MTKGRQEKLEAWTSQDTGYTLYLRKVSTLLRAEVRRQVISDPAFAEPQPPMTSVDYGEGAVLMPHRGHPIYQDLLREWHARVNEETGSRLKRIAIDRGVVVSPEAIDQDAVAEMRAIADLTAYDDRYVFIAFVAIGSEADWTDLLKRIYDRSAPSEAAIQAQIATFRPMYKGRDLFHPSLDPPSGLLQFEPSYELVRAARWRGIPWHVFDQLEPDHQALVIAEYRIEMRYQAVDSWEHRPSNAKKKRR